MKYESVFFTVIYFLNNRLNSDRIVVDRKYKVEANFFFFKFKR